MDPRRLESEDRGKESSCEIFIVGRWLILVLVKNSSIGKEMGVTQEELLRWRVG